MFGKSRLSVARSFAVC